MDCYLAEDKNFSSFPWGRELLENLLIAAKKYNIILKEFNLSKPPKHGFLLVLGVDSVLISKIAAAIKTTDLIVIQLSGDLNIFENKFISIKVDQTMSIIKSINMLSKDGRTRPALFGIQKNDTSDLSKVEIFTKYFNKSDVYSVDALISESFERFYNNIPLYDSVICANDIIAVYLLKRLKEHKINVPEQLYVVGNGNLWISSHISPTLTTATGTDSKSLTNIIFQFIKNEPLCEFLSSMELKLKTDIICRQTTACNTYDDTIHEYTPKIKDFAFDLQDKEIEKIKRINTILSAFSKTDTRILKQLYQRDAYEKIAENECMTYDSVKYHIKKIYSRLDIHSNAELRNLLDENLIDITSL